MKKQTQKMSDSEGQRIWGPLWTSTNLRNHGHNAGLPAPVQPMEPTTARGRRRRANKNS